MERREFIRRTATIAGTVLLAPTAFGGCDVRSDISAISSAADAMDEALTLMSKFAPLGNHAPMAVESLVTLGRSDRVIPFIEKYGRRFSVAHPVSSATIDAGNWKEALGRGDRNLDWVNFFQRELKENDWKRSVEKWTGVLSPGLCAAAGHGVIRTCHAVRSLTHRQTDLRLHELAEGLGYWAAYYQPLPEPKTHKVQNFSLQEAVARVPILPDDKRRRGSIMDQLRALDDFQEFTEVIDYVQITGKPDESLSRLTEIFARIYLERVTSSNDLILLHAVTAASGIRSLLPYLTAETTNRVIRYGWQTAAGLLSISGNQISDKAAKATDLSQDDLIERAATSNEEHSIKFTEACIREAKLNPIPIYLQAANEAVRRLPRH